MPGQFSEGDCLYYYGDYIVANHRSAPPLYSRCLKSTLMSLTPPRVLQQLPALELHSSHDNSEHSRLSGELFCHSRR
ncbi:hypothetical protein A0H81_03177 [Grifola frondosa]|uniref:Uncharacterized protein n=1 Tax=Grifola frondosa TaxID=5627 RepID=A0A1C7MJV9_GRIFR|nr:hypothetical protein A0H81_03177 [Grifola frondosa]